MVNRVDGVILGVGVVVLVASVIGVFLYDEQSPQSYTLSWGQSEAIALDEQTASGGPDTYTFETDVSEQPLARAEFAVQVDASGLNVQSDSVDVEVLTPEGQEETCSFSLAGGESDPSGGCSVEFELNPRPERDLIDGTNRTQAEEQAMEDANMTNGTGMWETTVTIEGDGLQDPNSDITLAPTVYVWGVTASQQGPGGRAG